MTKLVRWAHVTKLVRWAHVTKLVRWAHVTKLVRWARVTKQEQRLRAAAMSSPLVRRRARALAIAAAILLILVVALASALLALPLGWLRPVAEHRLSALYGRPVTVRRLVREDRFGLVPTIRLEGIEVAAPRWAGPLPTARVALLRVRMPLLSLLRGGVRVDALEVQGARLRLIRLADGRATWLAGRVRHDGSTADPFERLQSLRVGDTRVMWADERRHMALVADLHADGGFRLEGRGTQRGRPLVVSAVAGSILAGSAGAPFPFSARITSPLVQATIAGRMDHPFDFGHFTAKVTARGGSAELLDDIIATGLPGTQPVALSATLRRDGNGWRLDPISGSLGRSPVTGRLLVRRMGDRTRLDADLFAARFDFDDLSDDAAQARQRRRRAETGPRLFPETPIHLEHLASLDGRVRVRTPQLVVEGGSMFKRLAGTLVLDHRVLTVAPIEAGLEHGALTGRAVVDGRTDRPRLDLDLRVHDEQISDFFAGQDRLLGPLQGRVVAHGYGRTLRAALGTLTGRIGVVSRGATLQKRLAVFAGGDVLESVGQFVGPGGKDRMSVRCMVAQLAATDGRVTPRVMVLDTAVSRLDGRGSIRLADERIDLALAGRPKRAAALAAHPPIRITGTLSDPALVVAGGDGGHREGGLLGKLGRVVGSIKLAGHPRAETAPDADCGRLAAAALR